MRMMFLVGLWYKRHAERCWQVRFWRGGRFHGQGEITRGLVPALILAGGMHRLSFCKRVNGRGGRHTVMSRVCNGVIRAQVWQERIGRAAKVAIGNVRLGVAAIVAKLVVLELLIQFFFQGKRTANCMSITLDTLRWCLDMQVLNTGFNRHQDTFRTHQWSWTICKSRRKVIFLFDIILQSQYACLCCQQPPELSYLNRGGSYLNPHSPPKEQSWHSDRDFIFSTRNSGPSYMVCIKKKKKTKI